MPTASIRRRQRLPPCLRQGLQAAADVYACRDTTRRRCWRRPERGQGRPDQAREFVAALEKATIDSPRGRSSCRRRTTRCRTSTCARSKESRTRLRASRSSRSRSGARLQDVASAAEAAGAASRVARCGAVLWLAAAPHRRGAVGPLRSHLSQSTSRRTTGVPPCSVRASVSPDSLQ